MTGPERAPRKRPCQYCGKGFGRRRNPGGLLESRYSFMHRKYCSLSCASLAQVRRATLDHKSPDRWDARIVQIKKGYTVKAGEYFRVDQRTAHLRTDPWQPRGKRGAALTLELEEICAEQEDKVFLDKDLVEQLCESPNPETTLVTTWGQRRGRNELLWGTVRRVLERLRRRPRIVE